MIIRKFWAAENERSNQEAQVAGNLRQNLRGAKTNFPNLHTIRNQHATVIALAPHLYRALEVALTQLMVV